MPNPGTWTTERSTKAASPCCRRPRTGAGSGTRQRWPPFRRRTAAGCRTTPCIWPASAISACAPGRSGRTRTSACGNPRRCWSGTAPCCGRTWSCSPICSSCSSGSGTGCGTISTAWTSRSSATCPFMWPWTPPTCGRSRRASSWTTSACPRRYPACRRTTSAPTVSCGAIPCTPGTGCRTTASAGGSAGWTGRPSCMT